MSSLFSHLLLMLAMNSGEMCMPHFSRYVQLCHMYANAEFCKGYCVQEILQLVKFAI